MSVQSWEEVLYDMLSDGPTLTAAAEALLVPDVTIPAGYMYPGRILRVHIAGKASNVVTTPGTIRFRIRWGGLAGTLLVDSAALTQNVVAQTNKTFQLDADILCRSVGTSGKLLTTGLIVRGNKAAAASSDATPDLWPPDSLAEVSVDTTTAKALSITHEPSLATASITAMHYRLEAIN